MNAAVRDDVDARLEDADELVDRRPHRVVDDAVGLQREQRVDVVGGGDADRVDADELADVDADLVGGPRVATDQLEVGLATIALTDSLPTLPVVHCTTRIAICFCSRGEWRALIAWSKRRNRRKIYRY